MPFVNRDDQNKIVAKFANEQFEGQEFIADDSDELLPTPEELINKATEDVRAALQEAIDVIAKSLGFSGGNALMLYAGFTNPFQSLAKNFAQWEATVWVEAGAYKDQVLAGEAPMLDGEQAVAMMPDYDTYQP